MKKGPQLVLAALLVIALLAAACAPAAPAPAKPAEKPTEAPKAAEKAPAPKPAETAAPAPKPPEKETAAPKPAEKKEAPPSKPAAEKPPVKIGILASLTGPFAGGGGHMRDGFALYLDQKGGSLAGRKIELLVEDDETKPDVGLTKAKKLVERDNVQMIAGIVNSGVAYAVVEYLKAQKVPLLLTGAGADDLTKQRFSPYVYRVCFSNSQLPFALGDWAYKKGYRKASLLASDFAAGHEWAGAFARTFTGSGGTIVQEQYPALGAPDPGPILAAVKPDADVLFAFQVDADAMRFVPAYEQYGLKKRTALVGASGLTDEGILSKQGDSALGVVIVTGWTPALDTPANKAFVAAWEKKYNRNPGYNAVFAYEGAMMLDKALQATNGNIEDKEAFFKALEKVELTDAPRGPLKLDQNHNAIMNAYITEVKKVDGKLVNSVIETYPAVSQFWKWSPEEYMKMPAYVDLKGKWVK